MVKGSGKLLNEARKSKKPKMKPLQRVFAILSIGSLFVSLVFISLNLTGSTIGSEDTGGIVSVVLFVLGLVFTLFYFREKNKSQ
jgi:membrane protease YdiL (CAAX protease family)